MGKKKNGASKNATDSTPVWSDKEKEKFVKELYAYERAIREKESWYYPIGKNLCLIKEKKLYEAIGYDDFPKYCRERFNYNKSYVYVLIDASKVYDSLKDVIQKQDMPISPEALTPLKDISEEKKIEIYKQAVKGVKGKNGRVTARIIKGIVKTTTGDGTESEESEDDSKSIISIKDSGEEEENDHNKADKPKLVDILNNKENLFGKSGKALSGNEPKIDKKLTSIRKLDSKSPFPEMTEEIGKYAKNIWTIYNKIKAVGLIHTDKTALISHLEEILECVKSIREKED